MRFPLWKLLSNRLQFVFHRLSGLRLPLIGRLSPISPRHRLGRYPYCMGNRRETGITVWSNTPQWRELNCGCYNCCSSLASTTHVHCCDSLAVRHFATAAKISEG